MISTWVVFSVLKKTQFLKLSEVRIYKPHNLQIQFDVGLANGSNFVLCKNKQESEILTNG